MEGDIVLAHELVELYILGVLPPLQIVVWEILLGDADIADRGVEPDVEDFLLVVFERDLGAPLEVSGDASAFESLFEPGLSDLASVQLPLSLLRDSVEEGGELGLEGAQLEEQVGAHLLLRRGVAQGAQRRHQLSRVQKLAAFVALVALRIRVRAEGAHSSHVAIREEHVAGVAPDLHHALLLQHVLLVESQEDILGDLGLARGTGASEVVEVDVEPLVNLLMQNIVLVANLLTCQSLLPSLYLGRCSVLISPTYIKTVMSLLSAKSTVHVRR